MRDSIIKHSYSCFFCGSERNLEAHHCISGVANRKIADRLGLWVYLCPECHRGRYGVHGYDGADYKRTLQRAAEYAYRTKHNASKEDWIKLFGKSFLED